jgi:hypothetical protein
VEQLSKIPTPVSATLTVLVGIGGVVALALAAFIKLRSGVATAVLELEKMGPAGAKAAVGIQKASGAAGKAALAFAAMEVGSAVFNKLAEKSTNVDKLSASIQNLSQTGNVSGELVSTFGKDMDKLGLNAQLADSKFFGFVDSVENSIPIFGDAAKSLINFGGRVAIGTDFETAKTRMAGLDTAMLNFMNTTNDVTKSEDLWRQVMQKSGLGMEQLNKLLPQSAAKMTEMQTAAHNASGAQTTMAGAAKKAQVATRDMGITAGLSADQIDELKTSIDKAFSSEMSLDRATIALKDGLLKMKTELKDGTRTLDINKEAGRKNRAAVLDQIDAINNLRQARINHGQTLDQAQPKYNKDLEKLRATLKELGYDKKAVDTLINSYKKVPGMVPTKVTTPGLPQADTGIKNYDKKLDALSRQINTHVYVTGDATARKKIESLLIEQQAASKGISISAARSAFNKQSLASGGPVRGHSPTRTADNIPAMLTAQEFVQPVNSVKYYGVGFMEALRKRKIRREDAAAMAAYGAGGSVNRRPNGYAGGGTVMPVPINMSKTKIPQPAALPGPGGGGATDDWIVKAVHSAFPGLKWISKYRPGARTLSGNTSYHSRHRAVDWPASRPLAEWWNLKYKKITKEFISPWNDLNIHNGQRHTYTGAIYRQHNFAGGNAHDHIAVATGGLIKATDKLTSMANQIQFAGAAGAPIRVFDNGGAWPSGTLGANLSGRTEYVDANRGGMSMSDVVNLLDEQNRILRSLGGDVADALSSNTRRAVQLGRTRGPGPTLLRTT